MWHSTGSNTDLRRSSRGIHGECSGSRTVIDADGSLDLRGVTQLVERVQSFCLTCQSLVLDLTAVEFVDSSHIEALLKLAEQLETDRRNICLVVQPKGPVEKLLNQHRLCERFQCILYVECLGVREPFDC